MSRERATNYISQAIEILKKDKISAGERAIVLTGLAQA